MTPPEMTAAVARRAEARGLALPGEAVERLAAYLSLLAFWNRKTNLTSFDLSRPSDEAIDRLVLEGAEATAMVPSGIQEAVDIGSGGGSPAIPMAICQPGLEFALVEARARKAAFLREAVRSLNLQGRVENVRAEELSLTQPVGMVTMRAVRPDARLLDAILGFLEPAGRFLWFGAAEGGEHVESRFVRLETRGPVTVLMSRRRDFGAG